MSDNRYKTFLLAVFVVSSIAVASAIFAAPTLGEGEEHSVTANPSITGGTLTFDNASAAPGTTVKIAATPVAGNHLVPGSLKATYEDGGVTKELEVMGMQFTMPAFDVVVVASFHSNDYDVAFNGDNAVFNGEGKAVFGERYTASVSPDKGFLFSGIAVEMAGKNVTEGSSSLVGKNYRIAIARVAGDVTITVVSFPVYTVSFNANEGIGKVPQSITAKESTPVALPETISFSKRGHSMAGWGLTADTTEPLTEYKIGNADAVLYAIWAKLPMHKISFDTNGADGNAPSPVDEYEETRLELPSGDGMSKAGHDFLGWALHKEATVPLDKYYVGKGDVTLYAVWGEAVEKESEGMPLPLMAGMAALAAVGVAALAITILRRK